MRRGSKPKAWGWCLFLLSSPNRTVQRFIRPSTRQQACIRLPFVGFPQVTDVLVSELRWMSEMRYVVLILSRPLHVHISCIPIPLLGHALRAPVGPDSEFRVTNPIGAAVRLQRFPKWREWTIWNLTAKESRLPERSGGRSQSKRACSTHQE
jgi:hypothetical protein